MIKVEKLRVIWLSTFKVDGSLWFSTAPNQSAMPLLQGLARSGVTAMRHQAEHAVYGYVLAPTGCQLALKEA
jgi:hypothetical protein